MDNETREKVKKAKHIIALMHKLFYVREDGIKPKGYGNSELNKATDAMYDYVKTIQEKSS